MAEEPVQAELTQKGRELSDRVLEYVGDLKFSYLGEGSKKNKIYVREFESGRKFYVSINDRFAGRQAVAIEIFYDPRSDSELRVHDLSDLVGEDKFADDQLGYLFQLGGYNVYSFTEFGELMDVHSLRGLNPADQPAAERDYLFERPELFFDDGRADIKDRVSELRKIISIFEIAENIVQNTYPQVAGLKLPGLYGSENG